MRVVENFKDYQILDTSDGEKLENWAGVILIRPDPQIIWKTSKENENWNKASGHYIRSANGGGEWEFSKKIPESWNISYKDLKFVVRPTGFKHMGLFPEQAVNWDYFMDIIPKQNREIKVLNLFAYTGGASIACAKAGAKVCHVDSSKGMIAWAKENAQLSNVDTIRWIVDDCIKFVNREIKRGNTYDAIIMDPPSYGRGPNGEVWKLTDNIHEMVKLCSKVLSDNPLFFVLNSYSTGLSPSVMEYMLRVELGGNVTSDEIGIKTPNGDFPCGSTAIWTPCK